MRRETDEAELAREIAALEDEERSLQNTKKQREQEISDLHGTINSVKRELDALQDNFDHGEELELLGELLKKFPLDAED